MVIPYATARSASVLYMLHRAATVSAFPIVSFFQSAGGLATTARRTSSCKANSNDITTNSNDITTNTNPNNFLELFTQDIPLLDVRAEIEFDKGAFPKSVNIPILNDEQRRLVGICYKKSGPEAAFQLGQELITPEMKMDRLAAWKQFATTHPNGSMYCFRGGSRSNLAQQGLKDQYTIDYPLVEGGYKAMRTYLMEEMDTSADQLDIVMVGGRTGVGKTHLLHALSRQVDLEGLAKHRGSSFGSLVEPQPSQINFENSVSVAFLKLRTSFPDRTVFIEDEGKRIGSVSLPLRLQQNMANKYPMVLLDVPLEERVRGCIQDYVTDLFPLFLSSSACDGDDETVAHQRFREKHLQSLDRVQKRLGGDRHKVIHAQVSHALDLFEQSQAKDTSGFDEPTTSLLRDYYDPMYDY